MTRATGCALVLRRWSFAFAAGLALTFIGHPSAGAGTIEVPNDFGTIQAAINAATNGDTVLVAPGTYNESINYSGKAITVQSSGGAMVTTISGTGLGTSVVKFITGEGSDSILQGFTVTGGSGTAVPGPPPQNRGGGIYALGANPTIRQCRITNNLMNGGTPNGGARGAGIYQSGGIMTLVECTLSGNMVGLSISSSSAGGGLYSSGAPVVLKCSFLDNGATGSGTPGDDIAEGAGAFTSQGTFVNCEFRRNRSGGNRAFGGGASGGTLYLNCLFADNIVNFSGGGLPTGSSAALDGTGAALVICTAVNNTINFVQSGTVALRASTLQNCIVFSNTGPELNATATVSNSCIEGGFAGTGNISVDPLFVNATSQDYHLQSGSPCRDTGDRTLLPADTYDLDNDGNITETLARDLDVLRRIVNGQVDMGSYEWQHACLPDISPSTPGIAGNGQIDIDDLVSIITNWGDCDQCVADVNDDGHVNIDDLVLVITKWGKCQ